MSLAERAKSSSTWVLVIGSAVASGFNFYSFLVLPATTGVSGLEQFVRDNYLGGLYLFGIGSSIAPFSVFVFAGGRWSALARYSLLAALAFVAIGLGGYRLARWPWSYLCLLGGACMHAAGFFLASLMMQRRVIAASALQALQPALFAVLVSLERYGVLVVQNWAILHFISCFVGFAVLFAACDLQAIGQALRGPATEKVHWLGIVTRLTLSVSFPLFFQLELILCGTASVVNVGFYSMVQKLYASVATSLFGSVAVLMIMRGNSDPARRYRVLEPQFAMIGIASTACVFAVGRVIASIGKATTIPLSLIAGSAAVAFMFTVGSFINLKLNAFRPLLGLGAFSVSLALYLALFFLWRPSSAGGLLIFAATFFSVFIGLSCWITSASFGLRRR